MQLLVAQEPEGVLQTNPEAGQSCQGLFVVQQRVEHPKHYFLYVRADCAAGG
jgi:hypothetical protein